MPCGQYDKRRGSARCIACRKAHTKCDGSPGEKACSFCSARSLKCSYDSRRTVPIQIVQVRSAPRNAIVLPSWKHDTICFEDAFGFLPQFAALRSAEMIALSQTDENVSITAAIVGEVYKYRTSGGHSGFNKQRKRLQYMALTQLNKFHQQMLDPAATWSTGSLACVLMLFATNPFLNGLSDPCQPWMAGVSDYIIRTTKDKTQLSAFDKELIRICQLVDAISALSRWHYPTGIDYTSQTTLQQGSGITSSSPGEDIDYILSGLWRWSVMKQKMIEWVHDVARNYPIDDSLRPEQKVKGIELLCEVTSLQSEVLRFFLQISPESDLAYQMLAPYSYWILIEIYQQLQHGSWRLLDCELPAMSFDHVHKHASATLDAINAVKGNAGMSMVSLLPVALVTGMAMVSEDERQGVINLLNSPQASWFDFNENYKLMLLDTWSGMQIPSPNPSVSGSSTDSPSPRKNIWLESI